MIFANGYRADDKPMLLIGLTVEDMMQLAGGADIEVDDADVAPDVCVLLLAGTNNADIEARLRQVGIIDLASRRVPDAP